MNNKAKIAIAIVLTAIFAAVAFGLRNRSEELPQGAIGGVQPLFNNVGTQVYENCDVSKAKNSNIETSLRTLKARNPDNSLRDITAKEKASVKGCEIAKIGSLPRTTKGNYDIEIVSTNPIEGGVEVFARAWNAQGQIGFGKDGSVDIERFRFINPPVLVADLNGTIVREWTDADGNLQQRKLREDPQEALLQSLEHILKVKKQKFDNSKIQTGKIGNTTLTAYPAAGANEPVDGIAGKHNGNDTFATVRGLAGTDNDANGSNATGFSLGAAASPNWEKFYRSIFGFDTSSIGSDGIDSATLSFVSQTKNDVFSQSVVVDRNVPASTNAIAAADHNIANWDGVEQASNRITVTAFVSDGSTYNNFTLNATGEGNINAAGLSWFGLRGSGDFDNSAPTWSLAVASVNVFFADQAGTATDPKLVVEHSAAITTNATSLIMGMF